MKEECYRPANSSSLSNVVSLWDSREWYNIEGLSRDEIRYVIHIRKQS
jgi:hypothetical protein